MEFTDNYVIHSGGIGRGLIVLVLHFSGSLFIVPVEGLSLKLFYMDFVVIHYASTESMRSVPFL